jgi:hypothetical protein
METIRVNSKLPIDICHCFGATKAKKDISMQHARTFQNAERFQPCLRNALTLTLALATLAGGSEAFACATCGCSLSSDGAIGYSASTGWGISLDYNFIDQNQLRSGRGTIAPSTVAALNGTNGPSSNTQEVENQTINRYLTLGLSYSSSADWNYKLLVPYIDRSHTTYGQATTSQLTSDNISGATTTGIGDIKFLTSYQGILPTHNLGIQVGVKLPTGDYGGPNAAGTGTVGRNPVAFNTGPNSQQPSPGNLLDTSLQAGNGSTDLILGGYYYQPVSQNFDAFINGQYQFSVKQELNQAGADYRPGNQATLSFGVRYEANPQIEPQLQVNMTHRNADSGALADHIDVEGNVAYLSPGVTVAVAKNTRMYGFVQLPIYSQLSGYQLFPHYTASVGISHRF